MILSAKQLVEATGGILQRHAQAGSITTDTRQIMGQEWFIPLIGARFDAHNFLEKASELGCLGTIATRVPSGWTKGWIEVSDTLEALQNIARYLRNQFDGTVVGITGSAGKTTLRVMILDIAKTLGNAHGTRGNFNNHIGLPLTIFDAHADNQFWILEMGMNHFGEIELLQSIGRPQIRVITNVGAAHTEGVGSIEGVAKAKSELFTGAQPGDLCCINLDDPFISQMEIPSGVETLTYGFHPNAQLQIIEILVKPTALSSEVHLQWPNGELGVLTVPSPATHMAHNAVAAAAVGLAMGATYEQIKVGLKEYKPTGARLNISQYENDILVIDDAYNANPLSMRASINLMSQFDGRRVLCLGDMLELGPDEIAIHKEILVHATTLENTLVFTAGPRFMKAAEQIQDVISASNATELAQLVKPQLESGDHILFKGSRGIQMERCLAQLHLRLQA